MHAFTYKHPLYLERNRKHVIAARERGMPTTGTAMMPTVRSIGVHVTLGGPLPDVMPQYLKETENGWQGTIPKTSTSVYIQKTPLKCVLNIRSVTATIHDAIISTCELLQLPPITSAVIVTSASTVAISSHMCGKLFPESPSKEEQECIRTIAFLKKREAGISKQLANALRVNRSDERNAKVIARAHAKLQATNKRLLAARTRLTTTQEQQPGFKKHLLLPNGQCWIFKNGHALLAGQTSMREIEQDVETLAACLI